jgi:predicted Zn finger-like uncharacterized protein
MSFNVTQCPACESTFNINSKVLEAAAGKVRCGACLNVFQATENFPEDIDNEADHDGVESVFVGNDPQEFFNPSKFLTRRALTQTTDSSAHKDAENLHSKLEQSKTLAKTFFTTVAEELHSKSENIEDKNTESENNIFREEPYATDSESNEASRNTEAIEQPEEHSSNPLDSTLEQSTPEPETAITEQAGQDKSLLGESSDNQNISANEYKNEQKVEATPDSSIKTAEEDLQASIDFSLSASFTSRPPFQNTASEAPTKLEEVQKEDIEQEDDLEPQQDQDGQLIEGSQKERDENDEDFLRAVADGINEESLSNEEKHEETLAPQDSAVEESTVPEEDSDHIEPSHDSTDSNPEESTEAIRARALKAELQDEEALEAIPRENLAALGKMSTPVELLQRREKQWRRNITLFLSIILLGALLSAQYLWQHMEIYSQVAQLRPIYEFSCLHLDCELPEYSNIDSIRSDNLSVQPHPEIKNGLMVNTIIRNTAPFPQAFPILILSFNSAENSIIALREFTSTEYLPSGLQSFHNMPAATPVQINLAIMDPGPEAVNYTLAFRHP